MKNRTVGRLAMIVGLVSILGLIGASTASGHGDEHEGPTFEVQVLRDPVEGWNILIVTDLIWAPENVSTEHVEGEGHAHIYVDGVKVSRIYGMWHFLGDLEPGTHEIRIELSNNDHSPLIAGEHVLDHTVTIEQPEPTGHTHEHEPREVPADLPTPSISAEAVHDPAGGFNLRISVENFTIDGTKASRDPVDGEGHAHLYINGEKVTRIYEEWTQITGLDVGRHELTVALYANDHAPLTHNGAPIQTTFTLDATAELLADSGEHDHHGAAGTESGDDMGHDMDDMGDDHHDGDGMDDMGHGDDSAQDDHDMDDDQPMRDMATG